MTACAGTLAVRHELDPRALRNLPSPGDLTKYCIPLSTSVRSRTYSDNCIAPADPVGAARLLQAGLPTTHGGQPRCHVATTKHVPFTAARPALRPSKRSPTCRVLVAPLCSARKVLLAGVVLVSDSLTECARPGTTNGLRPEPESRSPHANEPIRFSHPNRRSPCQFLARTVIPLPVGVHRRSAALSGSVT